MEALKSFGPLETALVLLTTVAGFFWKGDDALSKEAKARLGDFLSNHDYRADPNIFLEYITSIFDNIFGRFYLSSRFLLCSFGSSGVALALMLLIWWDTRNVQFRHFIDNFEVVDIEFSLIAFGLFNVV